MKQAIIIPSFRTWLANDKNVAVEGSFWDSNNIEIRKHADYVTLNRAVTEQYETDSQVNAIGLFIPWNSSGLFINAITAFCDNWKVFDRQNGEIWREPWNASIRNIASINGYNYIITASALHRFQNQMYINVLPATSFSSGWSGTNWSFSGWAVHATGSTASLTQTSPITTIIGQRYHIVTIVSTGFSWTCTVSIGGATSSNLVAGRNDIYLTATSTAWVSFTPSSTFNGTITFLYVDRVSETTSPSGSWVQVNYKTYTGNGSKAKRPFINVSWDLIVWVGTHVMRLNVDGTLIEWTAGTTQPVIGWLDGEIFALTQIGTNIYVWCNNWASTNMYIWDGLSSRPSQKINVADKPVINVALLANQHYWWATKGDTSQRYVFVWDGYNQQTVSKSDIIQSVSGTEEQDRLAIYGNNTNAIETYGDIVYLPWYGKVFWFWKYYNGFPTGLTKEFTYDVWECTALLTGSEIPNSSTAAEFYMCVWFNGIWGDAGKGIVWLVDFRDWNGGYATSGSIETMEYIGDNLWQAKNNIKMLVPFMLGNSACSIKVYTKKDQWSYVLQNTLTTTDYGTGFTVAELTSFQEEWHTLQFKFELITSSATYTPRLYVGFTNLYTNVELR